MPLFHKFVFYQQPLENQVQRGLLQVAHPDVVGHTASAATLSSTFLTVTVPPGKKLVLGIWCSSPLFAFPAASGDDADSQNNTSIVDNSPLD